MTILAPSRSPWPALAALAVLVALPACHRELGPQDMPWARTLDPQRDHSVWTHRILEDLRLHPGLSVGDIGAGAGYFSFKIAPLVGPAGHVWATDADEQMVAHMEHEASLLHVTNLTPLKVAWDSTGLRPASVDRLLMVNSLSFPTCQQQADLAYLEDCYRVLRSGGLLVILRDAVHTPRWRPPYGDPLKCRESTGDELARLAAGRFKRVSLASIKAKGTAPGVLDGFLLVLARR